MNVLYRIVILVFCIYGSYCDKYDSRKEQLHCIKSCRDTSNRSCYQPPSVCGDCLPLFEDRQGVCKPLRQLEFSNDEGNQGSGLNGAKKFSQEFPFIVAKKEESGMNYAVNESANVDEQPTSKTTNDILFIAVIASVGAAAILGIVIAISCWCKRKKSVKDSSEFEYPGYGSMDSKGSAAVAKSSADRRLAQSAQMYHYQHQKQQMLELEKNQNPISKSGSEVSSDEENDAGEFTVYECPGLATAGEMEVPNPLFAEPPSSALSPEIQGPLPDDQHPPLVNGFKDQ